MDIKSLLEANNIELQEFCPGTVLHTGMNQFVTLTEDVSYSECRRGLLHIEHLKNHSGVLCGFRLLNASSFSSRFLPRLLMQAWWRDVIKHHEHEESHGLVLCMYAHAFWLTLRFPQAWRVGT